MHREATKGLSWQFTLPVDPLNHYVLVYQMRAKDEAAKSRKLFCAAASGPVQLLAEHCYMLHGIQEAFVADCDIAARKRLKASGARTSLLTCSTKSGPTRSAAGLHNTRQQGQLIATRALTEPAVQGVRCQGPKLNGTAPFTSSAQLSQRPSCTSNSCNNLVRLFQVAQFTTTCTAVAPWLQLQEA